MAQQIMEHSIQTLPKLWEKTKMYSKNEILQVLELFRPLASDISAEVEHHANHCGEKYSKICDHVMSLAQPVLYHSGPPRNHFALRKASLKTTCKTPQAQADNPEHL